MQLMPKQLVGSTGQQYLKESRSVAFHLSPVISLNLTFVSLKCLTKSLLLLQCPSLDDLTHVMSSGFVSIQTFVCLSSISHLII